MPPRGAGIAFALPAGPSRIKKMAKKRSPTPPCKSVTAERAARLYRLVELVGQGPQTRSMLMRRLGLDVRGFYRDLELLRTAGITLRLQKQRYTLPEDPKEASARLPFPDPCLTLGEAQQLVKARSAAHRKISSLLTQLKKPRGR
jgi:predicted DNA-binding transcriptional regulator YafY